MYHLFHLVVAVVVIIIIVIVIIVFIIIIVIIITLQLNSFSFRTCYLKDICRLKYHSRCLQPFEEYFFQGVSRTTELVSLVNPHFRWNRSTAFIEYIIRIILHKTTDNVYLSSPKWRVWFQNTINAFRNIIGFNHTENKILDLNH